MVFPLLFLPGVLPPRPPRVAPPPPPRPRPPPPRPRRLGTLPEPPRRDGIVFVFVAGKKILQIRSFLSKDHKFWSKINVYLHCLYYKKHFHFEFYFLPLNLFCSALRNHLENTNLTTTTRWCREYINDMRTKYIFTERNIHSKQFQVYYCTKGKVRPEFFNDRKGGLNHMSQLPRDRHSYVTCVTQKDRLRVV